MNIIKYRKLLINIWICESRLFLGALLHSFKLFHSFYWSSHLLSLSLSLLPVCIGSIRSRHISLPYSASSLNAPYIKPFNAFHTDRTCLSRPLQMNVWYLYCPIHERSKREQRERRIDKSLCLSHRAMKFDILTGRLFMSKQASKLYIWNLN